MCASLEGGHHQNVWIKEWCRVYSALWLYNCLGGRQTVEAIEREKKHSMEMIHVKDAQYFNNLEDAEQYPAARCAQGPGIYMYHWCTSAAVESMNAANCQMCAKTAVDLLQLNLILWLF